MPQAMPAGSWGGQGSRLADTAPRGANSLSFSPYPKPCQALVHCHGHSPLALVFPQGQRVRVGI